MTPRQPDSHTTPLLIGEEGRLTTTIWAAELSFHFKNVRVAQDYCAFVRSGSLFFKEDTMSNVCPTTIIDFESNPPKPATHAELDWDAIRNLDIKTVARELGCEPDPESPSRWRFAGESSGKLSFRQSRNVCHHHKTAIGGGPIAVL